MSESQKEPAGKVIGFFATPDEVKKIEDRAYRAKMSISSFLRLALGFGPRKLGRPATRK